MEFFVPLVNTMALAGLLIALMVGLMLAPWQVLLLVLIAGLAGIERLKTLSSSTPHPLDAPSRFTDSSPDSLIAAQNLSTPQPASEKSQDIIFTYRGSTYKPPSLADVDDLAEISGKYRGQAWTQSTSK